MPFDRGRVFNNEGQFSRSGLEKIASQSDGPAAYPTAGSAYQSQLAQAYLPPKQTTTAAVLTGTVRVIPGLGTTLPLYPAIIQTYSASLPPPGFTDSQSTQNAWAQGPNGETLYLKRYSGIILPSPGPSGLPVYGIEQPSQVGACYSAPLTRLVNGGGGVLLSFATKLFDTSNIGSAPSTATQFTMPFARYWRVEAAMSIFDLLGTETNPVIVDFTLNGVLTPNVFNYYFASGQSIVTTKVLSGIIDATISTPCSVEVSESGAGFLDVGGTVTFTPITAL